MECLQTNARQRKNFLNGCKECELYYEHNSRPPVKIIFQKNPMVSLNTRIKEFFKVES